MEHVLPDCLFMELCPQRMAILENPPPPPPATTPPSPDKVDETGRGWFGRRRRSSTADRGSFWEQVRNVEVETGMSRSSALSAVLLTNMQEDYGDSLNITVGAEFREAYEISARQVAPRPRVILGDRPVRLTLLRAWESLSLFGRARLVLGLLWASLRTPSPEELRAWMDKILNDDDLLSESVRELSRHFPTMERVIIRERDEYMHAKLTQVARLGARRVVAVVGAGHCAGIRRLATNETRNHHDASSSSPEEVLKRVVETKRNRLDNDAELRSLVSDVLELRTDRPPYV